MLLHLHRQELSTLLRCFTPRLAFNFLSSWLSLAVLGFQVWAIIIAL